MGSIVFGCFAPIADPSPQRVLPSCIASQLDDASIDVGLSFSDEGNFR